MDHKKEYRKLLETVKRHRQEAGLPARNEDIADVLGYNRSYLSTLIGKGGTVTEDHIKDIKLHFPDVLGNQTNGKGVGEYGLEMADNNTLLRILDNLSAAHREISESNNILAGNQRMIISRIPISSDVDQENLEGAYATIKGVREFVIGLYAEVKNTTPHEAEAILGKIVVDEKNKLRRKDKTSGDHKKSTG